MVSRGKWKIWANGHFWTFWHKVCHKKTCLKVSLISLWREGHFIMYSLCPGCAEHVLKARAILKTQLSQISEVKHQTFWYSPTVIYENLDFKNLRFSNIHLFFNIHLAYSQIRKLWSQKSEVFQTLYYSVFPCSQIQKLGFQKSKLFSKMNRSDIWASILSWVLCQRGKKCSFAPIFYLGQQYSLKA